MVTKMVESMKFLPAQVGFLGHGILLLQDERIYFDFVFTVSIFFTRLASMKERSPFSSFQSCRASLFLRFVGFLSRISIFYTSPFPFSF